MSTGRIKPDTCTFDGWTGVEVNNIVRCADEISALRELLALLGAGLTAIHAGAETPEAQGALWLANMLESRAAQICEMLTEIAKEGTDTVGSTRDKST